MDTPSIVSGPTLSANEVESLKLVKHGIPLDDEMRQRLADARCIARDIGGWALTKRGTLWDTLG
jgi:hypothetical protein